MNRESAFRLLVEELNKRKIRYTVVGNTDGYPESIESDVDMVVHPDDWPGFHEAISDVERHGIFLVNKFQHEIVASYFILSFIRDGGAFEYLMPDVCTDYCRHGRKLIDFSFLLNESRPFVNRNGVQQDFYVPSIGSECLYYLLKKSAKGTLSDEQHSHLARCFREDTDNCVKALSKIWSMETVSSIVKLFAANDIDGIRSHLRQWSSEAIRARPVGFGDRFLEIVRRIRRFVQPTGFILSIPSNAMNRPETIRFLQENLLHAFRRIKDFSQEDPSGWTLYNAKAKSTLVFGDERLLSNPLTRALVDFQSGARPNKTEVCETVLNLMWRRMAKRRIR